MYMSTCVAKPWICHSLLCVNCSSIHNSTYSFIQYHSRWCDARSRQEVKRLFCMQISLPFLFSWVYSNPHLTCLLSELWDQVVRKCKQYQVKHDVHVRLERLLIDSRNCQQFNVALLRRMPMLWWLVRHPIWFMPSLSPATARPLARVGLLHLAAAIRARASQLCLRCVWACKLAVYLRAIRNSAIHAQAFQSNCTSKWTV